jgi:hypothetical protein
LSVGALVEFTEEDSLHFGKIDASEHKSNGGARYTVVDSHELDPSSILESGVLFALTKTTGRFVSVVVALSKTVGMG